MIYKISKSIINIPLQELNNFCIINDLELDIKNDEIIILEVKE